MKTSTKGRRQHGVWATNSATPVFHTLSCARGQGKIAAEHFPEESQIEIRKILSVRVPRPGDLFRVWKSNEKQSTIVFKGHKNHQIMNITDL